MRDKNQHFFFGIIPNDGSNRSRALLLLQQAGLITLKAGVDPAGDITLRDVTNFNGFDAFNRNSFFGGGITVSVSFE